MNAPEKIFLPDIQSQRDERALAIQQVGIKGLRYPMQVSAEGGNVVHTVADLTMTVALPADQKGTHMSRFVDLLESSNDAPESPTLASLCEQMLIRLDAREGRIEASFPYFIYKTAPVSGVRSLLDVDVRLVSECAEAQPVRNRVEVAVPVTSLCPCSKEISDYGAHNQRSIIRIEVALRDEMSVESLVRIAEQEASCEVFGLLKRVDEKWVTERAYDNPKFVEDLVRDIALRLMAEPRVSSWRVSSENFESIHNHSAFACIEGRNEHAPG